MKKYFLLFLMVFIASCDKDPLPDEGDKGLLPKITWVMSSGRFTIEAGETIQLVPDIENLDETSTYVWTIEGKVVGHDNYYTFTSDEPGEYFVKLTISNRYGKVDDEVKITVVEKEVVEYPEIPEYNGWKFPWTEINVAQGRSIKVKAYMTGTDTEISEVFAATELGSHTITLKDEASGRSQDFIINVCPPEGEYKRPSTGKAMVNRVYEYMPAPGHQVNGYIIVGESYPDNCTHEQACDSVLAHLSRKWSVSLGGQGGYLIVGFDHSVPAGGAAYDLCIKGNPFSYQSEPGIIWVSQDDNGDGLPNDQWFELAGSEYGTTNHTMEYAITYFRPEKPKSAIGWRDSNNDTGYIPYMSYWNPKPYYWQPWQNGTEMTFFGSRLRDRSTYQNGISDIPPYDWGYADNLGDFIDGPAGKMGYYKISKARTWEGQPANLQYIDFIKIQTAQTGSTPNLGEISTEVYYISDYHLE
jgi:hypothetical protein